MSTPPPARRPGFLKRLVVVVAGAMMLLLAQAVFRTGGVGGIVLGVVTATAGLGIIAIGAGIVEWWVERRRDRAG